MMAPHSSCRRFGRTSTKLASLAVLLAASVARVYAAPFAYVANIGSDSVSVLDLANNAMVATIPVGDSPIDAAINPAGTRVYVANVATAAISVINTASNTVVASVPLALPANDVAVNPDGTLVFALIGYSSHAIATIDAATNTVTQTRPVPGDTFALNRAGTRMYVAASAGTVTVLDVATFSVLATIPAGAGARAPVVSPDGTRVYVVNNFVNSITVIDATSNIVIATVSVGVSPFRIALDPAGTLLYVSNNGAASVSVIETAGNTVVRTVRVPDNPAGIAVGPTGERVYVGFFPDFVQVLGTRCYEPVTQVTVGIAPYGIEIAPGPAIPPGPPPAASPIRVTAIEVTQGIQDTANSMPLVKARRTYARVHVKSDTVAFPGVTATLSGLGGYFDGGNNFVTVPIGPIAPANDGGPRITVNPAPKRGIMDDSFLFELPSEWTVYRSLRLHATLSEPEGPPVASCRAVVADGPAFDFTVYTFLAPVFVRIGYTLPGIPSPDGDARATKSEQDISESWLRRTFPMSELLPAPDLDLYYEGLGSWVDRTDPGCVDGFDEADRNLCAFEYVVGKLAVLQADTGFIDGYDMAYGLIPQHPRGKLTRGACCEQGIGAGPANDEDYAAHEIGHFLGRRHPVEGASACGHSASDPAYPYFFSFIAPPLADPQTAFAGFDGGDALLGKPMRFLPPATSFDIMGYCGPTTWISDYTQRALRASLMALHPNITLAREAAVPPQPGDWLVVAGQVARDGSRAGINDLRRIALAFGIPPRPAGALRIRLRAAGGNVLADYPFAPASAGAGTTAEGGPASFAHVVPWVGGTRVLQIVDTANADAVLAQRAISAAAPQVGAVIAQLPSGSAGPVTLSWTASDPDGDTLRYDVLVARDGRPELQPLLVDRTGTNVQLDTTRIGGGSVRFRVVASDGTHTARAETAPVVLATRAPSVRILAPGPGARVHLGQSVNFEGEARDLQDGRLAGARLAWTTGARALGTGPRITVADLPAGTSTVTLTGTNAAGLTTQATVSLSVDADLSTPGPTLTAGPTQVGWHVAAGSTTPQSASLDIGNRGSGTLAFTVASGASWLVPNTTSGIAPSTVMLTADPSGMVAGTSRDATLTITAVGYPEQAIVVPVRLSSGNTFDTGSTPPPPDALYRNGFETP